jgi:hypothetical protein
MAASRAFTWFVFAALLAAASGARADGPAPAPAAPSAATAATRLGRPYPAPPLPAAEPREPPEVSVSIITPQDAGVHQHGERQRAQESLRDKRGFGAGGSQTPAPVLP